MVSNENTIYKGEKYCVAECVDLPAVTQGKTLDEVVENIKEAFISDDNVDKFARIAYMRNLPYLLRY